MMMLPKRNIANHNQSWSQMLDHSYRIIITGGLGSGKTNPLLDS